MTEGEAKRSLEAARQRSLRYAKLRNLWRTKVRRRLHRLRYIRSHGPRFRGNRVQGGTLEERIAYLFEHAPPLFRLFYSESGAFAVEPWAIHNVPTDTWRSDCSAWARIVIPTVQAIGGILAAAMGAGAFFYTGWVVANCQEVSRQYAETHIGTAVVYGSGTGFHMGLSRAQGNATIEHGTANLDYGTFDEFGTGTQVRYYKFLT